MERQDICSGVNYYEDNFSGTTKLKDLYIITSFDLKLYSAVYELLGNISLPNEIYFIKTMINIHVPREFYPDVYANIPDESMYEFYYPLHGFKIGSKVLFPNTSYTFRRNSKILVVNIHYESLIPDILNTGIYKSLRSK